MKKIEKLSRWLNDRGHKKESVLASSLTKVAKKVMTYKVKSGDVLGSIAEDFGTTVKQIQAANKLSGTNIQVGQVLDIPTDRAIADETDIVAMTLLGEGGTLRGGISLMKEVMAVLKNRSACRGWSLGEVALQPSQFSYWNSRDPNIVLYGDHGKEHPMWATAYKIAKNKEGASYVGDSTHYYVPSLVTPSWAKTMKVIYNSGGHHIYGIDMSISHYRKCAPAGSE
jgi:LysM repeat protein